MVHPGGRLSRAGVAVGSTQGSGTRVAPLWLLRCTRKLAPPGASSASQQQGGQRVEEDPSLERPSLMGSTPYFPLLLTGQYLVTWLLLAAREAGKCSL